MILADPSQKHGPWIINLGFQLQTEYGSSEKRRVVCMLAVLGNGCRSAELYMGYSEPILHLSLVTCVLSCYLMLAVWLLCFPLQ